MTLRFSGASGRSEPFDLAFSSRREKEAVREDRELLLRSLGFSDDSLITISQVHSDNIIRVEKGVLRVPGTEGDALISRERGLLLAVFTADCVPILLFDPETLSCGAVHAGWRGTAKGIASKAVKAMEKHYGARPEHILVGIGPSAGACCYETGNETAEAVREASGLVPAAGKEPGKFMVDLKEANRRILLSSGLRAENIEVSEACTICSPDFFSYRREGEKAGRMAAFIGLKS